MPEASNISPSGFVAPINESQREIVLTRTEHFMSLADAVYERSLPRIPVRFDLCGTTAGMFLQQGGKSWLRFNPWIFAKYFDLNLRDTVPHEVAHYVVHSVYGDRRVKPHGWQWREVMAHFGADPEVTFTLDLSGIPQRRQRTHPYRCACRAHKLSTTRHNRIQKRRGVYQCKACLEPLVYNPEGQSETVGQD